MAMANIVLGSTRNISCSTLFTHTSRLPFLLRHDIDRLDTELQLQHAVSEDTSGQSRSSHETPFSEQDITPFTRKLGCEAGFAEMEEDLQEVFDAETSYAQRSLPRVPKRSISLNQIYKDHL